MYPIQVELLSTRETRIRQLCDESSESQLESKFLSGTSRLKLIQLPVDTLLYRIENYRTRDRQKTLIAKNIAKPGLFDLARSEDVQTQRAQHTLLVELAKEGRGESTTDIYGELERVATQTEALIITSAGVVVNGNRRLSAMRELLDSERTKFKSFSHILCAVLPASATSQDIRDLEFRLQMQPDTKLPYDWTALGRGVLDMRADNYAEEKISQIMNRDKKELVRAVAMVNAADRFLGDWLETPNDFAALEKTEQAFIQIATKNKPRADDALVREATLAADFFLVENRGRTVDRIYNHINTIEENPERVLGELAEAMSIALAPAAAPPPQNEFDFEEVSDVVRLDYTPVKEHLKGLRGNDAASLAMVEKLIEICVEVSQQARAQDKAALSFARAALKQLNSVDLTTAGPQTHAELQAVLVNVVQVAQRLQGQLDDLVTAVSA